MNTSVSGSARSQIHSTVGARLVAQPASRTWPEGSSATMPVSLTSPQAASTPMKITRRLEPMANGAGSRSQLAGEGRRVVELVSAEQHDAQLLAEVVPSGI